MPANKSCACQTDRRRRVRKSCSLSARNIYSFIKQTGPDPGPLSDCTDAARLDKKTVCRKKADQFSTWSVNSAKVSSLSSLDHLHHLSTAKAPTNLCRSNVFSWSHFRFHLVSLISYMIVASELSLYEARWLLLALERLQINLVSQNGCQSRRRVFTAVLTPWRSNLKHPAASVFKSTSRSWHQTTGLLSSNLRFSLMKGA